MRKHIRFAARQLHFATGALALALALNVSGAPPEDAVPVESLHTRTHVHGLAVDKRDPTQLLVATHHGVWRVGSDGVARRVSSSRDDFMGFSAHPSNPDVYFASGHPASGGNLGFIESTDGAKHWRQVSPGANGPVDFHQMAVSAADPQRIYGAFNGLQVSRDGGRSWKIVGPAPAGLLALAASAKDVDTVYAATKAGLWRSTDAGATWKPILQSGPVSLVEVTPSGTLYAFVVGRGLMRAGEPPFRFEPVGSELGNAVPLHLAVDPTDPQRLFVATAEGRLLASTDGGARWQPLAAKP